jgi:hypothetical protein
MTHTFKLERLDGRPPTLTVTTTLTGPPYSLDKDSPTQI